MDNRDRADCVAATQGLVSMRSRRVWAGGGGRLNVLESLDRRRAAGLSLALAVVAACAAEETAAAPPAPSAPAVQAVIDCAKITESDQRLACYDKTVAAMTKAETTGDLVTIDREQRRAARRQAFGLTLPSLGFLARGEKPEEVNNLTTTVVAASRTPDGKWLITVEGGAVWRQIDTNELAKSPSVGSAVRIRTAALGSFFMNIDRQQAIRVHRVN